MRRRCWGGGGRSDVTAYMPRTRDMYGIATSEITIAPNELSASMDLGFIIIRQIFHLFMKQPMHVLKVRGGH
jgi:hypothetical protein